MRSRAPAAVSPVHIIANTIITSITTHNTTWHVLSCFSACCMLAVIAKNSLSSLNKNLRSNSKVNVITAYACLQRLKHFPSLNPPS